LPNQNGNVSTPHRDRETGDITTGAGLTPALLDANRADHPRDLLHHPLDDAWFRSRSPDLSRIEVPVYSAGNWGGAGLHLRGNVEGFLRAGSKQKWLDMHVGTHFESFYLPRYIERQKQFFAHFLKGEANDWPNEPPIRLEIRSPDGVTVRNEHEWPLARTQWQHFYLNAESRTLSSRKPLSEARADYPALGDGINFTTEPFEEAVEFTGPLMARLWVTSTTTDLDIFASLLMFAPDGTEVVFAGASDLAPVARGWLRASHRKCDAAMSAPYRPYHSHDIVEKLVPGEVYPLDAEIWPTSIVFPKGYRMVLTVQGRDFEAGGVPGRILHNHSADRPLSEFAGVNTVVSGPDRDSYLLLPLIPKA
jgi:predicted acyl esterase